MPGPKMGPRPDDFDEALVRRSPTFKKWLKLQNGETLTYACRQFVKGSNPDEEERLMRRIMIARRNNLKDHAMLKKARAAEAVKRGVIPTGRKSDRKSSHPPDAALKIEEGNSDALLDGNSLDGMPLLRPASPSNPSGTKRRRVAGALQPSDEEILMEMDVPAVEATRSYRKWLSLPDGAPFTYNQKYTKGKNGHDWLLKKNIWRRMRYRRENQAKVVELQGTGWVGADEADWDAFPLDSPGRMGADPAMKSEEGDELVSQAVVDAAAVAAANVGTFAPGIDADAVAALGADDPIVSSALDAAHQLAAAAVARAPTAAELEDAVLAAPVVNGLEENGVGDEEDVEGVDVLIQV